MKTSPHIALRETYDLSPPVRENVPRDYPLPRPRGYETEHRTAPSPPGRLDPAEYGPVSRKIYDIPVRRREILILEWKSLAPALRRLTLRSLVE